jgi:hypothetical protein
MTPEMVRRLACRCYLSFHFTSYLESNRSAFLIVSQFPTSESASMEPQFARCQFDAMLIAKALSDVTFRDGLMSDPRRTDAPAGIAKGCLRRGGPGTSWLPQPIFRLVEDLVNGRSDLQLRTSKKENIQGFAKLSLIFPDLPTSKR